VTDLILNSLETEIGGVQIYDTALRFVVNDDLRKEWQEYRHQTEHHGEILRNVCSQMGIDPKKETPGRQVVGHIGESLVKAMEMVLSAGDTATAELVATECVTAAETMDHHHWELIGQVAKKAKADEGKVLSEAHEEVEEQEDEHLYHARGGRESCGSRRSACPPFFRRRRKRRT
jgi:hypothetical protein